MENQPITPDNQEPIHKRFMNHKLASVGIAVAVLAVATCIAFWQKAPVVPPTPTIPFDQESNETAGFKTYTNTEHGFEFQYPEKLTLSTTSEDVKLYHTISFDNYDGGCDLKGGSKLSKTLTDFDLSIRVVEGPVEPSYVDGVYVKGDLKGEWAYMGAEGCGQTIYYFPISNNRTLVITKMELQILSDVVTKDVRDKVLAVPGVISNDESKSIINQILSSFKFSGSTQSMNLKTYSNAEYGFEIQYPKDMPISTSRTGENNSIFSLAFNPTTPPVEAGDPPSYLILNVSPKFDMVSCADNEGTALKNIEIGGETVNMCYSPHGMYPSLYAHIEKGEYIYTFTAHYYMDNKEAVDKIISSMRFAK